MQINTLRKFKLSPRLNVLPLIMFVLLAGCRKDEIPKLPVEFKQVNLVANTTGYNAARIDKALLNPWGIAFSATGTPWVSSTFGNVSTVYDREGNEARPPVAIPSPTAPTGGFPTGQVFNGGTDFVLSNNQPARFIFVGLDGVLSGWNGAAGNTAIRIINNSATSVYTGLALANDGTANFLYAANFRTGKIDVFDKSFAPVAKAFIDPQLPAGYSPFNIEAIENKLYVAYAKVGPDGRDVQAVGNGFVSIFNPDGSFVQRFASKGMLNSPWGIAKAPASFFGNAIKTNPTESTILIGNFGDGKINAYSKDGKFLGQLMSGGKPIAIEGLWAITFPPSTSTIDPNRLYFAAGPNKEADGLFGYIIMQ
jgi:uncharacterized protein (TIGR03118 family)